MSTTGTLLLAGALCLTGCSFQHGGPVPHDSQSIERDNSELVRVNLDMKAGDLRVAGGTDKLAAADFTYSVASWKPEVRYSSAAGQGSLTISQPGHPGPVTGNRWYEWDLRLNQEVPLDFDVHLGAGEAHLNLGALTLRNVDVEVGAGELNLDLRGAPKKDYEVRVHGGAGEAIIHLPSSVGVDAQASGGVGEINAKGLRKHGDRYVNDALGKSNVTIHLNVQGGVGSINLIAE
jgi:hypothetical protein